MWKICKEIRGVQLEHCGEVHGRKNIDSYKLCALDIACGYHPYLFAMARWQLQVSTYVAMHL